MNRWLRMTWLVVLVFTAAGCSTARLATWPHGGALPADESGALPEVHEGDTVTLTLVSGDVVRGRIIGITDASVTLDLSRGVMADNSVRNEDKPDVRTIPRSSVRLIHKEFTDGVATAGLIVVTGLVVGGVMVASSLQSSSMFGN
ncbi:MAG TPA: hypothetical protein PLQ13_00725 [Candidatus Krumholzibacteria bacterium]|nr:hypothetical protein [Candidatus Krumholzibacteria bacterium]